MADPTPLREALERIAALAGELHRHRRDFMPGYTPSDTLEEIEGVASAALSAAPAAGGEGLNLPPKIHRALTEAWAICFEIGPLALYDSDGEPYRFLNHASLIAALREVEGWSAAPAPPPPSEADDLADACRMYLSGPGPDSRDHLLETAARLFPPPSEGRAACGECGGDGVIETGPAVSDQTRLEPCPACNGDGGQTYRESLIGPCQSCGGTGVFGGTGPDRFTDAECRACAGTGRAPAGGG